MPTRSTVAYVTASDERILADDTDRDLVVAALVDGGLAAEVVAWDDPTVDWARFDLIVVRSPWDYPERVAELRSWLHRVGHLPQLHNPAAAIRWNLDKRYLAELAAAGLPVVPTTFVRTPSEAAAAIGSVGLGAAPAPHDEVVVKPTVSAGSRDTGRFARSDPAALDLATRIVSDGRAAMVQPAVPSVAERGEVAVVLIDGEVSHAYRKGPLLAVGGGLLTGEAYVEERTPLEPPPAWVELAHRVHDAACERVAPTGAVPGGPLLYARIDLVELPSGEPAVLEAELFEPFLSFDLDRGAAARFARACSARARGPVADHPG